MAEEMQAPAGLDIGALLGGILGSGGEKGVSDSGGGAARSDVGAEQAIALQEGIGKVLSDPQMMARLPEVIEMLRPMMGGLPAGGGDGEKGDADTGQSGSDAPGTAVPASVSHKDGRGGRGAHERRIALLCALRPYLSPRRQEAVDYILRMDKMGKLFRNG